MFHQKSYLFPMAETWALRTRAGAVGRGGGQGPGAGGRLPRRRAVFQDGGALSGEGLSCVWDAGRQSITSRFPKTRMGLQERQRAPVPVCWHGEAGVPAAWETNVDTRGAGCRSSPGKGAGDACRCRLCRWGCWGRCVLGGGSGAHGVGVRQHHDPLDPISSLLCHED